MEAVVYALLSILAVYAVSYAIVYLDGPFELLEKLRSVRAVENFGVLMCINCISFWFSWVAVFVVGFQWWAALGIWGGVIVLNGLITEYSVR